MSRRPRVRCSMATNGEPGVTLVSVADIAFTAIAPVLSVRDLDIALGRYRRLGFAVHAYDGAAVAVGTAAA